MQRRQGISAHAEYAPVEPDVAARLSAALNRLAALRATLHGDWSDGPASLLAHANRDGDDCAPPCWTLNDRPAPALDMPALPESPPAVEDLRGRFESAEAKTPPTAVVDVSWLDLVEDTTIIELDSATPGWTDADAGESEVAVATAFAEDCAATAVVCVPPRPAPEAAVVEIDDVAPVFAVGAAPEPFAFAEPPTPAPKAVTEQSLAVTDESVPVIAYGAIAGIAEFLNDVAPDTPRARGTPAAPDDAVDPLTLGAFGAAPDILDFATPIAADTPHGALSPTPPTVAEDDVDLVVAGATPNIGDLFALAEPVETVSASTSHPTAMAEDEAPAFAVGAFAIVFVSPTETHAPSAPTAAAPDDDQPDATGYFGAAPALVALLDTVPALADAAIAIRPFDPMSLIDDALADAFDALLQASDPIDPRDAAWTVDALADDDTATHLAACETAFWALPRHIPCAETFLLTPNHEIAVRLTRAIRVRADALQARAFVETSGFGFLRSDGDVAALWFMADALADATALSAGDARVDASFSDWGMDADDLLVVVAPGVTPPRRPPPLISEAELDTLFAHVDDARSRVVLDDLSDDPEWNATFWHDIDAYLEHVSEAMDPAMIDEPVAIESEFDIHDIEVRAAAPIEMAVVTTFFWMPGDADDLAVAGDGADLFIVGAEDGAAVVLVEDGVTHAMRTGKDARMDEVVVSLSTDTWRDIDGMDWRRIAVLSGVSQIRVMQNEALTRHAVLAGTLFATTLEDGGVRLVLSGAEGDVDYPVIRVGGLAPESWATLDAAAA